MPTLSMSFRTTRLLLVAASLTLAACASTSDRKEPPDRGERSERGERPARTSGTFLQPAAAMFAGMDLNRDKIISREEMVSGISSEWKAFGGSPSATSFANWSLKTLGSMDANPTFMSFDRDFNETVTEAEFTSQIKRLFTQYDKNGDGAVERSEMIVAFEAPRGRAQQGSEGGRRG